MARPRKSAPPKVPKVPKVGKAPRKTRPRAPAAVAIPSASQIRALQYPERVGAPPPRVDFALDLSSSCVGWALGVDKEVVTWGKIIFRTTAGLGEKLSALEAELRPLFLTYQPTRLLIEEPARRKGNTTIRHNEVMGVVRKIWWEVAEGEIPADWIIPATTVKKHLRVPPGRDHAHNKEIMVHHINKLLGLGLKYHTSKRISDDDSADAIALLIAAWRGGTPE